MPLRQSFAKRVCAVVALAVVAPPGWGADAAAIFRQAAPSVVLVYALDSAGEEIAQGSGVVVGENYVATNCHVLEGARSVKVGQTETDETFAMDASRARADEERDLCLLFVADLSKPPAAQPAQMAGARGLEIGVEVFAIGAPNGWKLSFTRGIVSQLRDIDGESAPLIQTDAAITSGSSGGGLFDKNGHLVGITTLGSKDGNFNFAMPAEWVAEMLGEKIAAVSPPRAQAQTEAQTSSGSLEWEILFEEAKKLWEQGNYRRGISVARKALKVAETSFGKDDINTNASVNLLGLLYDAQGDYAAAEPLYKRALAINEKTLGAQHPRTATSLNNLADLYGSQGDYAAAEPLLKRALAIKEKTLGAQHPSTAISLNNLAFLYNSQGDYAAAESLHKRALAIREKTLGAQHPDTATSLDNLAGLYKAQGDYAAAEPLHKRALAIREKTLGAQHPDTTTSLNNLALLYRLQGDYAAAEPLYKRALAISRETIGESHPHTVITLENMSALYEAMGEYAKAREYANLAKQARARQ